MNPNDPATMSSSHLTPPKTGHRRSPRSTKIKKEPPPPNPAFSSSFRTPLTGSNRLQLPAINVVPPTPPMTRFDLFPNNASASFTTDIEPVRSAHYDLSHHTGYQSHLIPTQSDFHPLPTSSIDLDLIAHFAPLKHCYTSNNRHMWEEDYQNWCFKAQYYFTTHHPSLHIALPSSRAFGVAQRGPLEKYMLEIDSFPLHPNSETFSTITTNRTQSTREYICFRCGKMNSGSFGSHEMECGYGIPPEQTVYYFAWETVPRPVREEMLLRVPRVWQDSARVEWGRTLCRLDEVVEEKKGVERKYAAVKGELEGREKRLRGLEIDLKGLMGKDKDKKRDDGSGKKPSGKENVLGVDLGGVIGDKHSSPLDTRPTSTGKKQKRSFKRETDQTRSKRQRIR